MFDSRHDGRSLKLWTLWCTGELATLQAAVDLESTVLEQIEREEDAQQRQLPQMFSSRDDRLGYNARVLSTRAIDCVLLTNFLHQKNVQIAKMVRQVAEIIKIDSNYKLPVKIHVYEGVGKMLQAI